ncbi:hypothetical protein jhhlp_001700 [Lomentospora prolificans]|uniref:NB-ARC domain-containing protein n=1 Tax=Lomentospora prolificans TaxID=41688 RepID=A0A2N3NH91_9PEZI|nr:hypothetical protein jhhlp_001700 [Lomentospora prolificans]
MYGRRSYRLIWANTNVPQWANTDVLSRPETPPQPFAFIPFYYDGDFADRVDLLAQVDQICSKPAQRVALVGLGGVGKSQLAIEYAHRTNTASTWVFWMHAGTCRKQPIVDILSLVYN